MALAHMRQQEQQRCRKKDDEDADERSRKHRSPSFAVGNHVSVSIRAYQIPKLRPQAHSSMQRVRTIQGTCRGSRFWIAHPGPDGGSLATVGWQGGMKAGGPFSGLPRELRKIGGYRTLTHEK